MKFVDGLMIHSGNPTNDYIQAATRHVLLRQGVLGLKVGISVALSSNFSSVCSEFIALFRMQVKIMLPHDPTGKQGPKIPLPDHIQVCEPKDEKKIDEPFSVPKDGKKMVSV